MIENKLAIKKRVIQYLDFKGVSKYRFYKETGLSNGMLDKNGAIGSDKCEIIYSQYPDINLVWFLTGYGEMIEKGIPNNNPIILRIIDITRKLGVSYQVFCKAINRDYDSKVNWYHTFTDDEIKNIFIAYPQFNPIWLLTGEGEMIIVNSVSNDIKLLEVSNESLKRENKLLEELLSVYRGKENI